MAFAMLFPEAEKLKRKGSGSLRGKEQFSAARLSQARTVFDYSEALANEVRDERAAMPKATGTRASFRGKPEGGKPSGSPVMEPPDRSVPSLKDIGLDKKRAARRGTHQSPESQGHAGAVDQPRDYWRAQVGTANKRPRHRPRSRDRQAARAPVRACRPG
jgi:hypothetical protein